MRRRDFIGVMAGLAGLSPLAGHAQQSRIPKVGFLYPGPSTAATARIEAFLEGLRTAGYRAPDQVEFIPPHCDPTVNLYDTLYVCRGERVEAVWPVKR